MKPKHSIGSGAECVYLFYYAPDRLKAEAEARHRWPCKIGGTRDLRTRLLSLQAAMLHPPQLDLVVRTDHARSLESAIHHALADRKVDSYGDEWFYTNPDEIELLAKSLNLTIVTLDNLGHVLRYHRVRRDLTQTKLGSLTGLRQATISIAENYGEITTTTLLKLCSVLGLRLVLEPSPFPVCTLP